MRQMSAETVERFRGAGNGGDLSRTGLAHELCVRENWFGRLGGLSLASGRKPLPRLAEELGVRIPEVEAMESAPHARPATDFADSSVCGSLRGLGPLSLERVSAAEDRRRWEAMIETHHPGGWRRPPGGQVRYWVCSQRYGVLGGIGFTAAGIQLGPRDIEIGWSGDARVVKSCRLIAPGGLSAGNSWKFVTATCPCRVCTARPAQSSSCRRLPTVSARIHAADLI